MNLPETLKRTPLYDDHLARHARMVPFGGWEMPVQYEGIIAEYDQTRQRAALFDISHMGEFIIEGDHRQIGLDRIVTMALDDLPVRQSRYGCILNDKGGVIDDLIVFRLADHKWFLVVNGATTDKDAAHFRKFLTDPKCFRDISAKIGKLDLQGPLSRQVLKGLVKDIEKLDYFKFDHFDLLGENVLISRTGYTGELGYEIFYPWEKTKELWQELLRNDKVKPAGLGARDVLRLEMGYSLYGHELAEDISPLEAGLERFVDFNKDFIGKEALRQEKLNGPKRKLVGVMSQNRRSPRSGQKIYINLNNEIGYVTSGTFSPGLSRGIGLALVQAGKTNMDGSVTIGEGNAPVLAKISKRNFYSKGSLKN